MIITEELRAGAQAAWEKYADQAGYQYEDVRGITWRAGWMAGRNSVQPVMVGHGEGPPVAIPRVLRLEQAEGKAGRLYVDGVVFPWATVDGFRIDVQRGKLPGVSLVLAAEKVEAELGEAFE
jgi:hypothetical protein